MKILMVGFSSEPTLSHLQEQAKVFGCDYEVCDLLSIRDATRIRIEQTVDDLVLEFDARKFQFSNFQSFYNRCDYADLSHPLRNAAVSRIAACIAAWFEFADALVVNRPSAGAANVNKFLHGAELRSHGFSTPVQVLLGNEIAAHAVLDASGRWINKGCSSSRSIANAVDTILWDQLPLLRNTPSLFQGRIVGPDVRVHVVADQVFPEKIISQTVDYRFPKSGSSNAYSVCDLPPEIRQLCIDYCRRKGLLFAGLDFKVDARDGEWYALEANPRPGYEYFDRRQGFRISKALLSLLSDGKGVTEPTKDESWEYSSVPFINSARRPPIRLIP